MQKWFFSLCLVVFALAIVHRPAVSQEAEPINDISQCLTVEDIDSFAAQFCQESCCTNEFNNPELSHLCTQEGTCCNPDGCECNLYELIKFGERCEMKD